MDTTKPLIARNLDYLMKKAEVNPYALEKATKVPQPTIHRILTGEVADPRTSTLTPLAAHFDVTVSELREVDLAKRHMHGFQSAGRVVALDDDHDVPGAVRIRRVKLRLQAGINGFAADPVDEEDIPLFFRQRWLDRKGYSSDKLIAIRVKGESMEPKLYEGDTVVVNTADIRPADGEIFAVNYEGEAVIKRLIRNYGKWFLTSDNPDQRKYPQKVCEGDSCIIIGRVVLTQTEFN